MLEEESEVAAWVEQWCRETPYADEQDAAQSVGRLLAHVRKVASEDRFPSLLDYLKRCRDCNCCVVDSLAECEEAPSEACTVRVGDSLISRDVCSECAADYCDEHGKKGCHYCEEMNAEDEV